MKKLFCLSLALVLCLSLAACASESEEDQAFEAANALLEAGDYDGAIAAFTSIGRYQEITAKIEEATRLRDQANAGFLFGTWKDITTGSTFVFEGDGKCTLTYVHSDGATSTTELFYTYADGVVDTIYPLEVQEIDGITHLVNTEIPYDLVPAANYEDLAPITVEITMDNWQEYFELREAESVQDNAFGEPEYRSVGYAVYLKDEYVPRLLTEYGKVNVSFELQYDEHLYRINGDLVSGEYTLEEGSPSWPPELELGATATTEVWDCSNNGTSQHSDFYGQIAGFFYGGNWFMEEMNGTLYLCKPINGEIIRVQGSLTLLR